VTAAGGKKTKMKISKTKIIMLAIFSAWLAVIAEEKSATVKTEAIKYKAGDVVMRGYLAYPVDKIKDRLPGVLVFSEWQGLNDYAKRRAEELAGLGYVAFAADMYGDGRVAKDSNESAALSGALKQGDRTELLKRATAALVALKEQKHVDPARLAAIGYCFGGTVALELARSGADLRAVVTFHGGLDTPRQAEPGRIKAAILVCHGADDPYAPKAVVDAFQEEMRKSGVDWQMVLYGDAVHSFSNPTSGNDKSKGAAYNEKADRRSWALMQSFLRDIFGK
jgi:dienelactone hydrolase